MDFPSGVMDCGLIEYGPGLLRMRGVAVAERVYVTCYGFATKAGIAYGRMQDITPHRRPTLCLPLSHPGHDASDGDDGCDDDQPRLS